MADSPGSLGSTSPDLTGEKGTEEASWIGQKEKRLIESFQSYLTNSPNIWGLGFFLRLYLFIHERQREREREAET